MLGLHRRCVSTQILYNKKDDKTFFEFKLQNEFFAAQNNVHSSEIKVLHNA